MPFNQPKLCPSAKWHSNGTTLADNITIGLLPNSIFVTTNNSIYAINQQSGSIKTWHDGSTIPTTTLVSSGINSYALLVTETGDIYLSDYFSQNYIKVWRENASGFASTLYTNGSCFSFFIDANNTLYCSMTLLHRVIRRSLDSNDTQVTTVAGIGYPGTLSHMFAYPRGIVVTINFDFYVADVNNNRIQFFRKGELNASTVVGSGATATISLYWPTTVLLDADGYLFISEYLNSRIVGSGPDGFRCVIGCTGTSGAAPDLLLTPQSMSFDSYGNIFVADSGNNRIQKFLLSFNSCSK